MRRGLSGHRLRFTAALRLLVVATVVATGCGRAPRPPRPPVDPAATERFARDVSRLTDDQLLGRAVGTPGLETAGEWIEERFRKLGLRPAGDADGYRQSLTVDPARCPPVVRAAIPGGERPPAFNLVGRLDPGATPRDDRLLILGAHYDHLGHTGSVPGEIYSGADDNASGVAALLETARTLSRERVRLARAVLFVAFSGEECGLAGSHRFVRHPPPGLERHRMFAMVNLDMVGRLRNDTLLVTGLDAAAGWNGEVARACSRHGLTCRPALNIVGPSDHISFLLAGVPMLYLSTGGHPDYHTPRDKAGRLNMEGGSRVAATVADLLIELAERPDAPRLRRLGPRSGAPR